MPSWELKKTALERQNSSPRRPWMPSHTPLDSKSEKSIPFWSLFVDWGYPLDALRDPKIDQKSSFCDNGCSKERCFIDLCGKCSFSRFFGGFLVDFSRKIDEKTDVFFHNLACFFQTGDLHETLYFTIRKLLFRVFCF